MIKFFGLGDDRDVIKNYSKVDVTCGNAVYGSYTAAIVPAADNVVGYHGLILKYREGTLMGAFNIATDLAGVKTIIVPDFLVSGTSLYNTLYLPIRIPAGVAVHANGGCVSSGALIGLVMSPFRTGYGARCYDKCVCVGFNAFRGTALVSGTNVKSDWTGTPLAIGSALPMDVKCVIGTLVASGSANETIYYRLEDGSGNIIIDNMHSFRSFSSPYAVHSGPYHVDIPAGTQLYAVAQSTSLNGTSYYVNFMCFG